MAVDTVGFSPSQTIPKNSLLRLTFGKRTGYAGGGFGFDPFGRWPAHMADVWAVLPSKSGLYTTTAANVTPNSESATVDARIHADRSGTEIINAIAAIDDNFVALKRVELLTPAQVAVANTNVGALARDAATKTEAAKAAADSPWTKLTTGLTLGLGSLKWVAIAVVLVVLLVAYSKVER